MSRAYVPKPDGFDHIKVIDGFTKAAENPEINVAPYLEAFTELARYCDVILTQTNANVIIELTCT